MTEIGPIHTDYHPDKNTSF